MRIFLEFCSSFSEEILFIPQNLEMTKKLIFLRKTGCFFTVANRKGGYNERTRPFILDIATILLL
jgi:hypothetical protein